MFWRILKLMKLSQKVGVDQKHGGLVKASQPAGG